MVREIKKAGKTYYVCHICKFAYKEKELAQKCRNWCEKYKSCNTEITKHALQL